MGRFVIGFRLLCAAWLAAQLFVTAASPAWGWFVPHEHATRGAASAEDWDAHWEAHRSGHLPALDPNCGRVGGTGTSPRITDAPLDDEIISTFDWVGLGASAAELDVPSLSERFERAPQYAREMTIAPEEPPPIG
jgi:hypothetical protein